MNRARNEAEIDTLTFGDRGVGVDAGHGGRAGSDRERDVLVRAHRLDELDQCRDGPGHAFGHEIDRLGTHPERQFTVRRRDPALVRRGLLEMKTHPMDFTAFATEADRESGIYGGHLERLFTFLSLDTDAQDTELVTAVRNVLTGSASPSPRSFHRLRSAGVLAGASEQEARLRCRLYANFLQRRLP